MDQTQSPPAPETPAQEVNRRAAQYVPQIEAGKAGIMLESMRRQANSYNDRVNDSHKMGQRIVNAALGGVSDEKQADDADKADDMGDMVICGDITQHYHHFPPNQHPVSPVSEIVKDKPAVKEAVKEAGGGFLKTLAPILLGSVMGMGGMFLGQWLAASRNKPAAVAKDVGARVRVYWGNTELQPDKPLETKVEAK